MLLTSEMLLSSWAGEAIDSLLVSLLRSLLCLIQLLVVGGDESPDKGRVVVVVVVEVVDQPYASATTEGGLVSLISNFVTKSVILRVSYRLMSLVSVVDSRDERPVG